LWSVNSDGAFFGLLLYSVRGECCQTILHMFMGGEEGEWVGE
jgi:hypothetical protein